MRALCWIGLLVSLCLLAAAVWFFVTMDPLIGIPFVLVTGCAGLMLGVPCASYLATGKFTGPPNP